MRIETRFIEFKTRGFTHILDITPDLKKNLAAAGMREGRVSVFAVGSTAGITTVEFEPGLVEGDIPRLLDRLAPYGKDYAHHDTWGDDNGAAHVRASLMGGSYTVPFHEGELILGTWQQIIFLDFDTRPRSRKVVLQYLGE